MNNNVNSETDFEWKKFPEAWEWVIELVDSFQKENYKLNVFAGQLKEIAGARLIDFVDHVAVKDAGGMESRLKDFGYSLEFEDDGENGSLWRHERAILPRVLLRNSSQGVEGVAVRVDSIAKYLMVRGLELVIQGSPFGRYRMCEISVSNGIGFWVVERRSANTGGLRPTIEIPGYLDMYSKTMESWQRRPRGHENEAESVEGVIQQARQLVSEVGEDLAAHLFIDVERRYWHARNRASRLQKNRLDTLGVGWANHDHHTFRSSRRYFSQLIRVCLELGFRMRERFYAGEEAGWGAQVVEHPGIEVTLFLDVDLAPEELNIDFVNDGLAPAEKLGTVGLWCRLHGDSLMEAGLHHLAVRSDFQVLTENLNNEGVGMMKPFSTFPHLQQAFTRGERWPIKEERIRELIVKRQVSRETAESFILKGAVGSHIENIQREDGYKGFSQKEVSSIIKETDPQHYKFE
jgi:hypothetical protein